MQDDTIRELAKAAGFNGELTPKLISDIKVKLADVFMADVIDGNVKTSWHPGCPEHGDGDDVGSNAKSASPRG